MKLKSAIIGLGKIGIDFDLKENRSKKYDIWTHYSAYKSLPDQFELVAAVEIDENKVKEVKKFDPNLKIVKNIRDLQGEKIDVVSICTPEFFHMQNIEECLSFCKGIFVEKPLASSEVDQDLNNFQNFIHEKKIPVYVNYYKRAEPAVIEILSVLKTEKITSIICKYSGFLDAVGSHAVDLINYILPINKICFVHHNSIGTSAIFKCKDDILAYLNHTGEKNKLIFELEITTQNFRFLLEDNLATLKIQKFLKSKRYQDYFELEIEKEAKYLTNPNRLVGFLISLHNDIVNKKHNFSNFDQAIQSQTWLSLLKNHN